MTRPERSRESSRLEKEKHNEDAHPSLKQDKTRDDADRGATDEKPGAQKGARAAAGAGQPLAPDETQEQMLRLRADFDNYRKRSLREKNLLCDMANQDLMIDLLPVLDHLQLAVKAADEHDADPGFQEGVRIIFDQLMGVLTKFGLEPIDAEGRQFDLNIHEAINCLPSKEYSEGTVIAQIRRGYLLKNRLLRPAQVIVSSGSGELPAHGEAETEKNNS